MPDERYRVRLAEPAELVALPAIEQAASVLYGTVPGAAWLIDAPALDEATFRAAAEARRLWVAVDGDEEPVGFALVEDHDPDLHLRELDVHPDHGRRGLGRRLVEAVLDRGRSTGRRVTLTTFRDVPWNAPFYRRLGFHELPSTEWTPALRAVMDDERRAGFDLRERVVMARDTAS